MGNFIFVSILEVLMVPLFVVFYNLRSVGPWWQLLVVALLATWALVVNGTFFAALSIRTRSREIMLPLILVSRFDSGAARHGRCHYLDSYRRQLANLLDTPAGGV